MVSREYVGDREGGREDASCPLPGFRGGREDLVITTADTLQFLTASQSLKK